MRSHILMLSLAASLALGSGGCIRKIMTDGQIQAFRHASTAFDTIGDYELARAAAQSGIVQFEGMHALSPDNTDALFMLTKAWVGYGYAFVEDDLEAAEDAGNDDKADYERKRARMAYDRSVYYGVQLLGQTADGFEQAKKSQDALVKWTHDHFSTEEDAEDLFWTGYAWLSRAALMAGDDQEGPAFVAELYVAIPLLKRAVEIDESVGRYTGLVALAAYHSRNNLAEADLGKKLFDEALAKTEHRDLVVQMAYATKYACMKGDQVLYTKLLNEVVQAGDTDPEQALENAVAKRRAKRWLGKARAKEQCGIDLGASNAPAPSPPASAAPPPAAPAEPTAAPPPATPAKPVKPAKSAKPAKAKPAGQTKSKHATAKAEPTTTP